MTTGPAQTRVIEAGGYGWRREDWVGELYPPDMPEEWRLAMYATEFTVVAVPAAYWRAAPEPEQWVEDVHPRFGFVLEVDAGLTTGGAWPALLAGARALQGRLRAIAVSGGVPDEARRELAAAAPQVPLLAAGEAGPADALAVWRPGRGAACGPLGWLTLSSTPPPAQLRALVEAYLAASAGAALTLIVDAPVGVLRDVQTMARLLGY